MAEPTAPTDSSIQTITPADPQPPQTLQPVTPPPTPPQEPVGATTPDLTQNLTDVQRTALSPHPETALALATSPDMHQMVHAHNLVHLIAKNVPDPKPVAPTAPAVSSGYNFEAGGAGGIESAPKDPDMFQSIGHFIEGAAGGVADVAKGTAGWLVSVPTTIVKDIGDFVSDPIKFVEQLPAHVWSDIAHWFDEGINTIPHMYRYTVEYAHKYGWEQAIGHLMGTLAPGMLLGGGVGGAAAGAAEGAGLAAEGAAAAAEGAAAEGGAAAAAAAAAAEGTAGATMTAEESAAAAMAAEADSTGGTAGGAAAAEEASAGGGAASMLSETEGGLSSWQESLTTSLRDTLRNTLRNTTDHLSSLTPEDGVLPPKELMDGKLPNFKDTEALLKQFEVDKTDWLETEAEYEARMREWDDKWAAKAAKESKEEVGPWDPPARPHGESVAEGILRDVEDGSNLHDILHHYRELHNEHLATPHEVPEAPGVPFEAPKGPDPLPPEKVAAAAREEIVDSQPFRLVRALTEQVGRMRRQLMAEHPTGPPKASFKPGEDGEYSAYAQKVLEIQKVEDAIAAAKRDMSNAINSTTLKWMNRGASLMRGAKIIAKPITYPIRLGTKFMTSPKVLGSELTGTAGMGQDHELWDKSADGAKWIDPFTHHHATMGQSLVALINRMISDVPGGDALHIDGIASSLISGSIDFSSQIIAPDPFGAAGDIYKAAHTAEGVSGFIGSRIWKGIGIRSEEDVFRLNETNRLVRKTNEWIAKSSLTKITEALKDTGTDTKLMQALAKANTPAQVCEVWAKAARANELVSPAAVTIGGYTRFKAGYRDWMDAKNAFRTAEGVGMTAGQFRRGQIRNAMRYMLAQRPWWIDSNALHGDVRQFELTHADPNAIPAIARMLRQCGESELTIDLVVNKLSDAVIEGDTTAFKAAALNGYLNVAESHLLARLGSNITDVEWHEITTRMRAVLQEKMQSIGLADTQTYINGKDAILDDSIVGPDGIRSHAAGESAGHLNSLHLLDPRDLRTFVRKYGDMIEGDSPAWSTLRKEFDTAVTTAKEVERRILEDPHNLTGTKLHEWLKSYSKVGVHPGALAAGEPDFVGTSAMQVLKDMIEQHGEVISIVKFRTQMIAERDHVMRRLGTLNTFPLDPDVHKLRDELGYAIHSYDNIISRIQLMTSPKVSKDWGEYTEAMGKTGKKRGKIYILNEAVNSQRVLRKEYMKMIEERCEAVSESTGGWRTKGQVFIDNLNNTVNNLWFKPLALFSQAWAWHVAISEAMLNVFRNGFAPTFSAHFAMQYAKKAAFYGLEHGDHPIVYGAMRKGVGGLLMGINKEFAIGLMGKAQSERLIEDAMDLVMMHPGAIHPAMSVSHGGASSIVDHSNKGPVDLGPYKIRPAYFSGKFKRYANTDIAIGSTWQRYADKILMDDEHHFISNLFRDKINAYQDSIRKMADGGEPLTADEVADIHDYHDTVIANIKRNIKNPAAQRKAIAKAEAGRDKQLAMSPGLARRTRIEQRINDYYDQEIAKAEEADSWIPGRTSKTIEELNIEREHQLEFELGQIPEKEMRRIEDEVRLEYLERLKAKPEAWRKQFDRNEHISERAWKMNQELPHHLQITPLEDWARVSVKTNMASWTSLENADYAMVHHPYLLNQIADRNIQPLKDITDYHERCGYWAKRMRIGEGKPLPVGEDANLFPSQIVGPEIAVPSSKFRSGFTALQGLSEKGHTKFFGPFVDWMSRQPAYLLEYHREMEMLRGRIANLALAEKDLPMHLAMTPEEMKAQLPEYVSNMTMRTKSYLEAHPNHKLEHFKALGGYKNYKSGDAHYDKWEEILNRWDEEFMSPNTFGDKDYDVTKIGVRGEPGFLADQADKYVLIQALSYMRSNIEHVMRGSSNVIIAFDREGLPCASINFQDDTLRGGSAADNSDAYPFMSQLHVGVLGSTGRAKNAATAVQYKLAEYADSIGLPVESGAAIEALPFHRSIGRTGASFQYVDDGRINKYQGKWAEEAMDPYWGTSNHIHNWQEEPMEDRHMAMSLWFPYHCHNIASTNVIRRLEEYEKTRNLALSSYGDLTGDQARLLAQTRAAKKMIGYVHNPAEKTALENAVRVAAPFYFAQNQAWRRAVRLLASDPGAFERYFKMNLAISNYAQTHQINGVSMTSIPGSQMMGFGVGMLASGGPMNYGLTGNLSSMHSMSLEGFGGGTFGEILKEFMPQFGPVANVPTKVAAGSVAWALRKAGAEGVAQDVVDLQNMAVGSISANKPIWMDILPSTIVKNTLQGLQSYFFHDAGNVWGTSYASTRNQVLIELADQLYQETAAELLKTGGQGYTANQLRNFQINKDTSQQFYAIVMTEFAHKVSDVNVYHRLCNQANRNTAILWSIKTMASFMSPLSLSLEKTGISYTGELTKLMQQYGATEGYTRFANKYPNHTVDAVFMSVAPEGITYPETAAAQEFFDKHGKLIHHDTYAGIMAYLIPRNKRGDKFDAQAYATELQMDLRRRNVMDNANLATPGIIQTIAINAGNNWYYNNIQFKASCYQGLDPATGEPPTSQARIDELNNRIGGGFGQLSNGSTDAFTVNNWVKEQVDMYGSFYNPIWKEYHAFNFPQQHAKTQYTQFNKLFNDPSYGSIYASMDEKQQSILNSVKVLMGSYQTVVAEYADRKKHSQTTSEVDRAWYDYLTNMTVTNPELTAVINSMFKHLPMGGTPLNAPNVA